MKKKTIAISLCFLFGLISWGFIPGVAEAKTNYIRVGATSPGSFWYVVGARVADLFNHKIPNTKASLVPGGSVANPRSVARGEIELGMTWTNNSYLCYNGLPPYKKAYPNIRFIGAAQIAMLQCVARRDSNVYSYKDLSNKRINPLKIGWGTRVAIEIILKHYGMTFESIKKKGGVVHGLGHSDGMAMMQDGKLDVLWAFGGLNPHVISLAENPGIRLIGLDENIADKAIADPRLRGMFKTTWPKGVYKGCDEDVPTIGVLEAYVVNENMPDDIAYQITKVLYESSELQDVYKGSIKRGLPSAFNIEHAHLGAVIPVHPGAKRYFQEKGVKVE